MASKIKVAESEEDKIDPFNQAEIAAIVQGFEADKYFNHYTPFVKFLFMTGCRTSEAVGLQWKHVSGDLTTIHFEEAVVDGHRKGPKTRGSLWIPGIYLRRHSNRDGKRVLPRFLTL